MRRAAEKLKSRRGASIVLALLFLLLCVMVGVSILAAAASNAGRTPSNRDEQQIYLALSSSLRLVVDDLTKHPYTGKAEYDCNIDDVHDSATPSVHLYYVYTYKFRRVDGDMPDAVLGELFLPYLNDVFETYLKTHFDSAEGSSPIGDKYRYEEEFVSHSPTPDFILTVTPDGPLDGYEAEIHVTISDTFRITMRASLSALPDDDTSKHYNDYWMETTLSLVDSSLPELQKPTGGSAGSNFEAQIDNAEIKWKPDVIHSGYGTP